MNPIETNLIQDTEQEIMQSDEAGQRAYDIARYRGVIRPREGLLPKIDNREVDISGATTADIAANLAHSLDGLRRITKVDNNSPQPKLPVSPSEIRFPINGLRTVMRMLEAWRFGQPGFENPTDRVVMATIGMIGKEGKDTRKFTDLIKTLKAYAEGFKDGNFRALNDGSTDLQDTVSELLLLRAVEKDFILEKKLTDLSTVSPLKRAPIINRLKELGYEIKLDSLTGKFTLAETVTVDYMQQKQEVEDSIKAKEQAELESEQAKLKQEQMAGVKSPRPENSKPVPVKTIQQSQLTIENGFHAMQDQTSLLVVANDSEVAKLITSANQKIEVRDQIDVLQRAAGIGGLPILKGVVEDPTEPEMPNGLVMERIHGKSLNRYNQERMGLMLSLSPRLWLVQDVIDIYRTIGTTHGDLIGLNPNNDQITNLNNLIFEESSGRIRIIDWGDRYKTTPIDNNPARIEIVKRELSAVVKLAFGQNSGIVIGIPKGLDENVLNQYENYLLSSITNAQNAEQLLNINLGV